MFLRNLLPAISWALFILVLCLLPGKDLPEWEWFDLLSLDKLVHAGMFFVLTILIHRGLRLQYQQRSVRSWIVATALIASVCFGAFTEFMQEWMLVGRHGDLLDQLANTAGAVVGVVYLRRRKGTRT